MNLFHIEVEPEQDETARMRTWLVVADSLFVAISLIPDGYTPKSVEVQLDTASGPGRIIGWMEPPATATRAGPARERSGNTPGELPPMSPCSSVPDERVARPNRTIGGGYGR